MKILYLSPSIPSRSGTGGKVATYKHIAELVEKKHTVDLVIVDSENSKNLLPESFGEFKTTIFPPKTFQYGRLARACYIIYQMLFDARPWSVSISSPEAACKYIKQLETDRKWDIVVVDHLRAFGLIGQIKEKYPIIYIAHNIESDLMHQELHQCSPFSLRYFYTYLNLLKLRHYELSLAKAAVRILTISEPDQQHFARDPKLKAKAIIWPELPEIKNLIWEYKKTKRLLFVGAARHFPNREAAIWLIEQLMPKLYAFAPEIRLSIVGMSQEQIPSKPASPNIDFLGFVSDADLVTEHLKSDLFVCPVILGGGIKIKILEAASYGMPVLATPESMKGINFLKNIAAVNSRNASDFAATIIELLESPNKLRAQSQAILESLRKAIDERANLSELLETFATESALQSAGRHRQKFTP